MSAGQGEGKSKFDLTILTFYLLWPAVLSFLLSWGRTVEQRRAEKDGMACVVQASPASASGRLEEDMGIVGTRRMARVSALKAVVAYHTEK